MKKRKYPDYQKVSINYVYELALEQGKFYVGTTNDVIRRFNEHKNYNGSKWTMLYDVKEILAVKKIELNKKERKNYKNNYIEDDTTLKLMYLYGYENVRGGKWSEYEIEKPEELNIIRQDWDELKNKYPYNKYLKNDIEQPLLKQQGIRKDGLPDKRCKENEKK